MFIRIIAIFLAFTLAVPAGAEDRIMVEDIASIVSSRLQKTSSADDSVFKPFMSRLFRHKGRLALCDVTRKTVNALEYDIACWKPFSEYEERMHVSIRYVTWPGPPLLVQNTVYNPPRPGSRRMTWWLPACAGHAYTAPSRTRPGVTLTLRDCILTRATARGLIGRPVAINATLTPVR